MAGRCFCILPLCSWLGSILILDQTGLDGAEEDCQDFQFDSEDLGAGPVVVAGNGDASGDLVRIASRPRVVLPARFVFFFSCSLLHC